MRRALLLLALVAVLAGCGSAASRPSGVVERWLTAVGDVGRPSVREDAEEKLVESGLAGAEGALVDDVAFEEDASRFTDFEVGAAAIRGDDARVPIRVTRRLAGDEKDEVFLTAVLERRADGVWGVTDLDRSTADERVPSKGGDRPASATARHWLAAVAFGALAAVASALVIESQPAVRQQARPDYVPAAPQRPTEENQRGAAPVPE